MHVDVVIILILLFCSLTSICTDLSAFIELFKHLKSLISTPVEPSQSNGPLIDEKNGVIGLSETQQHD